MNDSAKCNVAQLVSGEGGSVTVPTCNWTDFFATRMKRLLGIKKFHHFHISFSSPGDVFAKEHSESAEVKFHLLKEPWTPGVEELSSVIPPHGLSAEWQWYLNESIRPFCPVEDMDTICPLPTPPKPQASRGGTLNPGATEDDPAPLPPKKRNCKCGTCQQEGHNSRTCPE